MSNNLFVDSDDNEATNTNHTPYRNIQREKIKRNIIEWKCSKEEPNKNSQLTTPADASMNAKMNESYRTDKDNRVYFKVSTTARRGHMDQSVSEEGKDLPEEGNRGIEVVSSMSPQRTTRKKRKLQNSFTINIFKDDNTYTSADHTTGSNCKDEIWRLFKELNALADAKGLFNFRQSINRVTEECKTTEMRNVGITQTEANTLTPIDVSNEDEQYIKVGMRNLRLGRTEIVRNLNFLMHHIRDWSFTVYPYKEPLRKFCQRLRKISNSSKMWIDYRHDLLLKYKNFCSKKNEERSSINNQYMDNNNNNFSSNIYEDHNEHISNHEHELHEHQDNVYETDFWQDCPYDHDNETINEFEGDKIVLKPPPDLTNNVHIFDEIEERRKIAKLRKDRNRMTSSMHNCESSVDLTTDHIPKINLSIRKPPSNLSKTSLLEIEERRTELLRKKRLRESVRLNNIE